MTIAPCLRACPSAGLRGEMLVPGDKSISHRALILGGLAAGETRIEGLLESEDVIATAAAVRAFGAAVHHDAPGRWRVSGGVWRSPASPIDCGNAGTAARLLMGAAAGFPLQATFDGDNSLRRRPMRRVAAPLEVMGARFEKVADRLPLTMRGGGLRGITHRNARASAQVKSAILLAGLRADGPVEVIEPARSRDHSEIMLGAFGCEVETMHGADGWTVRLGVRRALLATDVSVPGDPSSAAFAIVAALLVPGSEVSLRGVLLNPLRTGLFDTLVEMGADLRTVATRRVGGELVGDVVVRSSTLRGVDVPAARAPSMIDEYPALAVAAAFAEGPSVVRGLGELRHKESDRLAAIVAGLRRCGVDAQMQGDDLLIRPDGRPEGGAQVETEGDHRIAMAFLVLGLVAARPVEVDRPEMIATSFPAFPAAMRALGARLGEAQ